MGPLSTRFGNGPKPRVSAHGRLKLENTKTTLESTSTCLKTDCQAASFLRQALDSLQTNLPKSIVTNHGKDMAGGHNPKWNSSNPSNPYPHSLKSCGCLRQITSPSCPSVPSRHKLSDPGALTGRDGAQRFDTVEGQQ